MIDFTWYGECTSSATLVLEGYANDPGHAHGALVMVLNACAACAQPLAEAHMCDLTVYRTVAGRPRSCGDAILYDRDEAGPDGPAPAAPLAPTTAPAPVTTPTPTRRPRP
ncbi:hypothetical protein HNR25_002823 [Streptomonospora salina]|uniref:Uncharacterized protein n=1 Tax=Streptomonospora salina TaxID=104205 RepID=A0A841E849_9ACTN|nr:hypothetical protein [Streptomonospora salina]